MLVPSAVHLVAAGAGRSCCSVDVVVFVVEGADGAIVLVVRLLGGWRRCFLAIPVADMAVFVVVGGRWPFVGRSERGCP